MRRVRRNLCGGFGARRREDLLIARFLAELGEHRGDVKEGEVEKITVRNILFERGDRRFCLTEGDVDLDARAGAPCHCLFAIHRGRFECIFISSLHPTRISNSGASVQGCCRQFQIGGYIVGKHLASGFKTIYENVVCFDGAQVTLGPLRALDAL